MTIENTAPENYMTNSVGHLVPIEQVREIDKLRDQLVLEKVAKAIDLNAQLSAFKKEAFEDIQAMIDVSAERYDVFMGGKKGNVTLHSYSGKYKMTRSYAERLIFTEEIEIAKELITQCIDRWTTNSSNNVRALVDRAFKTNNQGRLKTSAILDLLRLEIDEPEWKKAMLALKESIQVSGTSTYVRFYERIGDSDNYQAIVLDMASV